MLGFYLKIQAVLTGAGENAEETVFEMVVGKNWHLQGSGPLLVIMRPRNSLYFVLLYFHICYLETVPHLMLFYICMTSLSVLCFFSLSWVFISMSITLLLTFNTRTSC